MATYDLNYTHSPAEFKEMQELQMMSYLASRKPFNWRPAIMENWNFASRYLEPIEYFTERVRLWRNDAGELIGFLMRDNFLAYPQVQYGYRYLEAQMIDWAEMNWATDRGRIGIMVYDWDIERQQLLSQRGYKNQGAIEDVRIYDLSKGYAEVSLPPGFRITSLAEYGHYPERIDLENKVWGASLDDAWFRGKSSAPSYSFEWDLVVISPEERMVAQSLVWLYPKIRSAEIDPLGVHPEFRKRGLSKDLVLESLKRMREGGLRYAYIASETQDHLVSHLYSSLQPIETYQGYHWRK
jgi:ribosomal protein S18 acetylase RimI-like enzyme